MSVFQFIAILVSLTAMFSYRHSQPQFPGSLAHPCHGHFLASGTVIVHREMLAKMLPSIRRVPLKFGSKHMQTSAMADVYLGKPDAFSVGDTPYSLR